MSFFGDIADAVGSAADWAQGAINEAGGEVLGKVKPGIDAFREGVQDAMFAAAGPMNTLVEGVGEIGSELWDGIVVTIEAVDEIDYGAAFEEIGDGIADTFDGMVSAFGDSEFWGNVADGTVVIAEGIGGFFEDVGETIVDPF